MTVLVADVEVELQGHWKRCTLTGDQMISAINAAIRAYGKLSPLHAVAYLKTVSGVRDYRLPDGVDDVFDVVVSTSIVAVYDRPSTHPRDTSDVVISNIIEDAIHDDTKHLWGVSGRVLTILPEPSATDEDIEVYYVKPYLKNSDGTEWPDIPSRHIDAIVALSTASLLDDERLRLALTPDYRSGLISISRGRMQSDIQTEIHNKRRQAAEIIGVMTTGSYATQGDIA